MIKRLITHFIILLLLFTAAGGFFYRAFLYVPYSHDKILSYLLQIKQIHTELNKDILKVTNGILKNYDTLVKDVNAIRELQAKMDSEDEFMHQELSLLTKVIIDIEGTKNADEKEFEETSRQYKEFYDEEMLLLEDFKRNYSIYRNSLIYFPILINDVENKLPETAENLTIKYKLEEFLSNVLMFSINGKPEVKNKITESRDTIAQLIAKLPDDNVKLVDKITKHKDIIIEKHDKILSIINKIFALNPSKLIDNLHNHYSKHKEIAKHEIEIYRICFYLSIIILIIYISNLMIISFKRSRDKAHEANQLKSEFLASISHELRTPMNGIIGISELLLESTLSKSQQNGHIQNILLSAENLLELLNDVLDFSKIESGKLKLSLKPFDLQKSVQEVLALMKIKIEEKDLKVEFTYDSDIPQIFNGDELRIKQILYNLIGNSIKFTEKGSVEINIGREEEFIKVVIKDTGIGMSTRQQSIIFDKFMQGDRATTRKYGGTGLGLAICKELVEMMGGDIGARSIQGKGSTFWFKVRLYEAKIKEEQVNKDAKDTDTSFDGVHILMAEDNRVNAEFTKEILSSMGCKITLARNGLEALEIISNDNDINLVFMDCDMPQMDGFEATAKIREFENENNKQRIPIIALTANAMKGDEEKCKHAGMDDYLTKPVRKNDLANMLNKWIK